MDGEPALERTPLYALHLEQGARMVPFAGYAMPVQYSAGIIKEHQHTRAAAGLFDVSHMGQAILEANDASADAAALIEELVPGEIQALGPGHTRYSQLLNERGGILDDLMITRLPDQPSKLFLVVNAACKAADFDHIAKSLAGRARLRALPERALLALQGPQAATVLTRLQPRCEALGFLQVAELEIEGRSCLVGRSGYTGEDGFEISLPNEAAEAVARRLLQEPEVLPIGLGARDSLRLEAGLCLYGHDIDETTTPVEANLTWSIGKRRRAEGGFPGAAIIQRQLAEGPERLRVGLRPEGRAPIREGVELAEATDEGVGRPIGRITSGGFGPSIGAPIAMGYVARAFAEPDTAIFALPRGEPKACHVARLPFVPTRSLKRRP